MLQLSQSLVIIFIYLKSFILIFDLTICLTGYNLKANTIVVVFNLPEGCKDSDLFELYPEAKRIMMGPDVSSRNEAG